MIVAHTRIKMEKPIKLEIESVLKELEVKGISREELKRFLPVKRPSLSILRARFS